MLYFGLSGSVKLSSKTKGYLKTEGRLSDYTVYSADDKEITYRLVYTYTVDGNKYTVSTDYGTGVIPPENTMHLIRYDPDDPSKAVVIGGDSYSFLIVMGIMFTAVPTVMFLGILVISGRLDISKFDFLGLIIGIVLIVVSFGFIYLASGSLSIISAFEHIGFLMIIPCLLIAAGTFTVVKALFLKEKKEK